MAIVSIELDDDTLANALADLTNDEILEILKKVDTRKSEWDFITTLYPWMAGEHRKMVAEELEDKANREERCQRSAEYPDIHHHVDPHRGCILR